jgi:hypothetical protein
MPGCSNGILPGSFLVGCSLTVHAVHAVATTQVEPQTPANNEYLEVGGSTNAGGQVVAPAPTSPLPIHALWQATEPNEEGVCSAGNMAKVLKESGLSSATLRTVCTVLVFGQFLRCFGCRTMIASFSPRTCCQV